MSYAARCVATQLVCALNIAFEPSISDV